MSNINIRIIDVKKIQHPDFKVKYEITIKGEPYIVSEAMYHLGEYENIIFNPDDISKIRLLSTDDLNNLKQQIEDTVKNI